MSTVKTMGTKPLIHLVAQCLDCKVRHEIKPVEPGLPFMREMDEWSQKHLGHTIEFYSAKRDIPRDLADKSWMQQGEAPWYLQGTHFKENSNIKIAWAASVAMTFTSINSLASSTSLAGASALAVDNTGSLYLDYLLSGFVKNNTGAAPTVGTEIAIWGYRSYDDTPTYPDVLLGTDATKTITTANILYTGLKPIANMVVAATTSQINPFDFGAISGLWNGVTPKLWSVWAVQATGQALASSGNTISYQGSYVTVT